MHLPKPLQLLWNGWMKFSHVFGLIMNTIILTVLWIVGFGLYAIILRVLNIRQLFQKTPESYWHEAKPTPMEEMHYPF